MRAIVLLLAAALAGAQTPPAARPINPAVREAVAYPLTTPKLDQYQQASRNVTALITADPAYAAQMNPRGKDAPSTVDETVTWSKQHVPKYVAAVEKTGMPFREYIVFQACLVITLEAYKRPQYVASFHIRRENIAFVQANRPKIEAMLAEQHAKRAAKGG